MKYLLIKINEQNGEQEYTFPYLKQIKDNEDFQIAAEEVAKSWYGAGEAERIEYNNELVGFDFLGGQISVSVDSVKEIPKKDYDVLNKYI